jgi:hypothetical protein
MLPSSLLPGLGLALQSETAVAELQFFFFFFFFFNVCMLKSTYLHFGLVLLYTTVKQSTESEMLMEFDYQQKVQNHE